MEKTAGNRRNPLGFESVGKLLRQFTLPSIVAMLVTSLYNIVDQAFIGHSEVGSLGNAATSVAFPMSISSVAIALLFGIGGAACFNLHMGRGEKDKALHYYGNAAVASFLVSLVIAVLAELFMTPMLRFFGSSETILPYAVTYTSITAIGLPFITFASTGAHLIRADGSPKYTMLSNLTGAVINTILDPILIFGFHMGMAGAAIATIIGQFASAGLVVYYYRFKFKTDTMKLEYLIPHWRNWWAVIRLGLTPFFNQIALMIVQIVMNHSLVYYGGLSIYGQDAPLACVGIISKVNMVYSAFCIGISQGMQPIASFNYGAEQYDRVREVILKAIRWGSTVSVIAFILFQLFPTQIIGLFGVTDETTVAFAVQYFHVYLFATFVNNLQPITSNFFTAIGKPGKGIFLSLTRQIIFLLPLILLLPLLFGIDGIMFAGPVADGIAAVLSVIFIWRELKIMPTVNGTARLSD